MSKIFFGKANLDEYETNNHIYQTKEANYLGDIQPGDYAFIKIEKEKENNRSIIKRLWKLKEIKEDNGTYKAFFDEICQFHTLTLAEFTSLDLFILDLNLLNKCYKHTKGLSFISLSVVNPTFFESLLKDSELLNKYIDEKAHYRQIVKLDNVQQIKEDSTDVQLYKDGEFWKLVETDFIAPELINNFDSSQFDLFDKHGTKGKNTAKEKMFNFLSGAADNASLDGLWDLFCGNVKKIVDPTISSREKREEFIEYCKKQGIKAAAQYENGISSVEKKFGKKIDDEYSIDGCKKLLNLIDEHIKELDDEEKGNKRNWPSYVKKYIEFKKYQDDEVERKKKEIDNENYSYEKAISGGINKIFYGTPGCGKSYYVENKVLADLGIDRDKAVFRTTFYLDYSNSDFVGQIMPTVHEKEITYEIIPGPFTLALTYAINNPNEKVALIIEELNRGNAPAIFGDIFQLLDRKNGTSDYRITNVVIQNYLKKHAKYIFDYIKLPSNLYIFATMNTSDQNVFTLDTAFKRRWQFEKVINEINEVIANKFVPGFKNVRWKKFVDVVNKFIISHSSSLSAEDKQLGLYFIDESLLMVNEDDEYSEEQLKGFAYKVFEYLWSDVAKFNRSEWFTSEIKTLDDLIIKFTDHQTIFTKELSDKLELISQDTENEN